MTTPQIRPMSVAEILAQAMRLFQQNLILLVMVTFLPQAVLLGVEFLISDVVARRPEFIFVVIGAVVVMNAVALSAITVAVAGATIGFPPTILQTYSLTLHNKLPWVVMAYIATAIITMLGFALAFTPALVLGFVPALMLGFVPTLVLGGYLAITIPAIVLESLPPFQAIARSFGLMREELAKGIAVFGFVVVISGVLPLIVQLLVGGGRFAPLLGAVVGSVTLPLAYTANVILYFSVRAKTGYDVAQLESDLADRVNR